MDQDTKRNIKLGLFVLIGLVIFIFGIFLVGAKSGLFSKSFSVYAIFKNTSGLKPGGNIRFDGVKVGIVKSVTIVSDSSIRVDMNIDESKHVFITKTAVASIASDGLMGDKLVNITSGTPGSPIAESGDQLQTKQEMNMDKMIATLGGTSDNINAITSDIKNLTNELNVKNGSISALFKDTTMTANLQKTLVNFKTVSEIIIQESNDLRKATNDITHGNGVMADLINNPDMKNNLNNTIVKLKETSDKLGIVADQANTTMQHINTGKGPVNTLLTDTALSGDLKASVVNIKNASATLNEDLIALQHNFLLKGYFRKKNKAK